jgi:hypothetical protein
MVPPSDMLTYLRTVPFRPFQIRMTGGRTYEIRHPEMVRVGKNSLIVFTFVSDDPQIYDRWETVSLTLIESLTHLVPQST